MTGQDPTFTVVAGNPDDDEVAALTAVLCALLQRAGEEAPGDADGTATTWTRRSVHVGPHAWSARNRTRLAD